MNGRAPSIFFLKGDKNCEILAKDLLEYRWKIDKQGIMIDQPEGGDDDRLDALRYLCQNVPINKKRAMVSSAPELAPLKDINSNWLKKEIQARTGENSEETVVQSAGDILYLL